jgi:uncharacterized membrane protein YfcA
MTPLLILVFGFAPSTAVGTDLLYAGLTKIAGTLSHERRGNVEWRIVGLLCAGSIPASAITMVALHTLVRDSKAIDTVLSTTLGVALLATAASLLLRGRVAAGAPIWQDQPVTLGTPARRTILLGSVLGVLVTLSSVGAGALGSVCLLLLYPRLAAARIVGSDIAHAVPLTLVAGLGHAAMGGVNWVLLASLLVGSIPGIWLGSMGANRLPERLLRGVLATALAAIGARLVL